MKIASSSLSCALVVLAACGEAPPPVESPASPKASSTPPVTAMSEAAPVPANSSNATAPEPNPAEKKKADDARQLAEDRAIWARELASERARWTPEVRAAAKKLADKGTADVKSILASTHRKPTASARDAYRHPQETLAFFGVKPTSAVLDVGPGEGWYTEILAPLVMKKGAYLATTSDPNGPPDARGTFYGQRFKDFLETSPELYGKVKTIVVDGKSPKLGLEGSVDAIVWMRGVHGAVNGGTLATWLGEMNRALKKDGVLGIEEHRAKADANPQESAKKGYVPEKWLIEQVEAAGFKLAAKSEINANPKDTKDYAEGVWTLPPTLRLKEVDKEKYMAIGESDRMTLKFVKAPPKATK